MLNMVLEIIQLGEVGCFGESSANQHRFTDHQNGKIWGVVQ